MNKLIGAVLALLLVSCEKNINFDLKESPNVLVVDAEIENGKTPTVVLTRSFSYFSSIDPQLLASAFVHNADVFISNGTLTHKLKEYTVPVAPGYAAYFYGIDSSSLSTAFAGEFNTSYTLKVTAEGQEYNAAVKIPTLASVPDTIYFKQAPFNPDTTKRAMFVKAHEPAGLGNYYRYFTKLNSEPFYPGYNSVFDDKILDGSTYDVQFPQGVNKNDVPKPDSIFYKVGDTVTFKFCNIDKSTYDFWNTWEFAFQSIGNPFSQPNKVQGNISNGALGAFSAYAAWYRTLIVK
ncbi:MAG: DUF4249 domain-containing protein [Ferruginibacter sp.]